VLSYVLRKETGGLPFDHKKEGAISREKEEARKRGEVTICVSEFGGTRCIKALSRDGPPRFRETARKEGTKVSLKT